MFLTLVIEAESVMGGKAKVATGGFRVEGDSENVARHVVDVGKQVLTIQVVWEVINVLGLRTLLNRGFQMWW
jgi:hypothetical protein